MFPGPPIDHALLALDPACFPRFAELTRIADVPTGQGCARHQALAATLAGLSSGAHRGLVAVAAKYAVLTLREAYRPGDIASAYPAFLLGAWLWDDAVDTNKGDPQMPVLVREGASLLDAALRGLEPERSGVACGRATWGRVFEGVRLFEHAGGLLRHAGPELFAYASDESAAFVASFADKVRLTSRERGSLNDYLAVRERCVGMRPSLAFSYLAKTSARGVSPAQLLALLAHPLAGRGARLVTLHCAAINDLFSIHKDRVAEDTLNMPAVLGCRDDLDSYFEGATGTIGYVRHLHRALRSCVDSLPEHPARSVLVETWEHMVEGNLIFHLTVPRYRAGVCILGDLLAPGLSEEVRRARFKAAFAPPSSRLRKRLALEHRPGDFRDIEAEGVVVQNVAGARQ